MENPKKPRVKSKNLTPLRVPRNSSTSVKATNSLTESDIFDEPKASSELIGITHDDKEFKVPKTSSMMSQLLNADLSRKNAFDIFTISAILFHVSIFFLYSTRSKRFYLGLLFAFWRLSYNLGLGLILRWQSNRQGLVSFFRRYGLQSPKSQDKFAIWIKHQLEVKMGADYKFENVPLEFNVWLIFRQLVDVVLMCDFMSYFLFALSHVGSGSKNAEWWQISLRHLGGWILVLFNLWVKMDAHRVVKDYAWYWGDFFFKVKQWLVFDGVFEMAPHPMYSIGYAGYYGASLISGSYTVFFASFLAHIMQFMFLSFIENPHIEKTYEKPPIFDEVIRINKERTKKRIGIKTKTKVEHDKIDMLTESEINGIGITNTEKANTSFKSCDKSSNEDTKNRVDSETQDLELSSSSSNLSGSIIRAELVGLGHFAFFRPILIRVIGLGYVLKRQSDEQWWTKWFIKRGGTVEEAFQSWKAFYNVCLLMINCSFLLVGGLAYFWKDGSVLSLQLYTSEKLQITLFRHSLGLIFIGLQIWSSKSIYSTLGDFGWFYGDFFVPQDATTQRKLLYTGIYRYINSPEKVLGQFVFFGISLISGSWSVFALALFLQLLLGFFYTFVVDPHMRKLYGNQIRSDSGVTKTIKKAIEGNQFAKALVYDIPNKLVPKAGKPLKALDEVQNQNQPEPNYFFVPKHRLNQEISEKSQHKSEKSISELFYKPLFASKSPIQEFFKETKDLISSTRTKISQKILSHELDEVENLDLYSFDLKASSTTSYTFNAPEENSYQLGEPIYVSWQVPVTHSRKDWIGIYQVTSNIFSHVSSVSSQGKYVYIHPDDNLMNEFVKGDCTFTGRSKGVKSASLDPSQHKNLESRSLYFGDAVFSGSALPWTEGVYEMRLHHGPSHAVIATSKPFTIKGSSNLLDNDGFTPSNVSKTFLGIVNRCLSVTVTAKIPQGKPSETNSLDHTPESEVPLTQETNGIKKVNSSSVLKKLNDVSVPAIAEDLTDEESNTWRTKIINPLKNLDDSIGISNSLDDITAKRLAGSISAYFKIDYSPDVLIMAAKNHLSVEEVANHIYKGKCALDAFIKVQTDLLISPDDSAD